MARSIKTEAMVLKKRELLGKDVSISLFTEEEGKISAIAKGIKKITSRRSPHLQTGNLIKVQLNKKKETFYLEESNLISGFTELKQDQNKVKVLYQYLFVIERLLPEHQKEQAAYNLTKSFLVNLSQNRSNDILITYLNKLLKVLGYTKQTHSLFEIESIISDLINEKIPLFNI